MPRLEAIGLCLQERACPSPPSESARPYPPHPTSHPHLTPHLLTALLISTSTSHLASSQISTRITLLYARRRACRRPSTSGRRLRRAPSPSPTTPAPQDGQSGRLGGAIAGLHGLIGLHLKAWDCPPHSGGETQHLRSHREAVTFHPEAAQADNFAAFDHPGPTLAMAGSPALSEPYLALMLEREQASQHVRRMLWRSHPRLTDQPTLLLCLSLSLDEQTSPLLSPACYSRA